MPPNNLTSQDENSSWAKPENNAGSNSEAMEFFH
jgi:hypothetical protein